MPVLVERTSLRKAAGHYGSALIILQACYTVPRIAVGVILSECNQKSYS